MTSIQIRDWYVKDRVRTACEQRVSVVLTVNVLTVSCVNALWPAYHWGAGRLDVGDSRPACDYRRSDNLRKVDRDRPMSWGLRGRIVVTVYMMKDRVGATCTGYLVAETS